nr:hypothetical protein [uncultured Chryseobacterium sp.]
MRILLLTMLLFSAALTAQKQEKFRLSPKTDTAKNYLQEKPSDLDSDKQQKLYRMLTLKPKDTSSYLALKQPKKNYSPYKILNTFHSEKPQIAIKAKPFK